MQSNLLNHLSIKLSRLNIFKSRWLALMAIAIVWCNSSLPVLAASQTQQQSSIQPYLERVAERITEFTLENGLKFIVLENHEAPLVSFVTYADVGGVDEPDGQTGVAHFLEHLAFKGTKQIGTSNYSAEAKLLDKLDILFAQIQQARSGDEAKLAQLNAEFAETQAAASEYVEQNKYGEIVDTAGGVGLNAATSADYTSYLL